jgi:hypothetical protein
MVKHKEGKSSKRSHYTDNFTKLTPASLLKPNIANIITATATTMSRLNKLDYLFNIPPKNHS